MPSEVSKPYISETQASELLERVFGLAVSRLSPLPSYDDQNFHAVVPGRGEFLVKVTNTEDSCNAELLEAQTRSMMYLQEQGLPVPTPLLTRDGNIMSLQSIDCGSGECKYMVRVLTYLPGIPIAKIPSSPQILYEAGSSAATLDKVLQGFEHPSLQSLHRENFIWSLSNIPLLESYLDALGQEPTSKVVKEVIQQFKDKIQPNLGVFRKCINHGDFNDHNILIEAEARSPQRYRISGILDFGDMSYGYYVFEVAICIMYMMIESEEPLSVGGHVLAGYESVIPLNPEERDALFLLVLARFCQSLVMARHSITIQPTNAEYLMITARSGWKHLLRLWEMGREAVEQLWFGTVSSYQAAERP
ncbi:UNVERIFIED_CONTAM: hypothetical protein FKN15_023245 [Acipenser sinensis]